MTPLRAAAAGVAALALLLALAGVHPADAPPVPKPPVFAAKLPSAPIVGVAQAVPAAKSAASRQARRVAPRPQERLPWAEDAMMIAVAAPATAVRVETVVMVLQSPEGTAILQMTTFQLPPAPLLPLGRI